MTNSAVVIAFLSAVLWILCVSTDQWHEMLVGACVTLATTLFLLQLLRTEDLRLHFKLVEILQGWRLPGYMVARSAQITRILLKDLFTRHRAGSYFRVCGYAAGSSPEKMARGVLATAFTTAAPNFIVIGIDSQQHCMLFHQIERSEVSPMTRNLGAEG